MVMRLTADFLVGGSNPGEHGGAGTDDDSRPTRCRTADLKLCGRLCYHSTGV